MEFIVVSEQLTYMLYSLVFGLVESAIYSIIKIIRMLVGVTPIKEKKLNFIKFTKRLPKLKVKLSNKLSEILFVHILDILYLTASAVAFSIFVYYFNHGRVRWYLLLSLFAGFLIWYHSLGKLIMLVSEYIVYIIKSFTKLFLYVIIIPLKFALKPFIIIKSIIKRNIVHRHELKRIRKRIFEG